ncbi:MAG: TonB-dependent receptor [Prevotella sp.]|nr:TonB-dependent receptor [Prevotella sp.]
MKKNHTYTYLVLVTLLLIAGGNMKVSAQSQIRGRVVDEEDYPVSYATVALLNKTDSTQIGGGITDEEGVFAIACDSVEVIGKVSYIGLSTAMVPLYSDRENTVMLQPDTQMLEEVVVEGDRTYHVKHTATGEIYYLSKYAKKSKDPFRALQEIPKLRIDVISKSVETIEGLPYYILVDGKSVNSGISPIDPKEIASVEVIEAVDARYMQKGIRKILNIRLKKKRKPYLWNELGGAVTIPSLMQSGSFGGFETGNPRFSVYGDLSLSNTYHKETENLMDQHGPGYDKYSEGQTRNNTLRTDSKLMAKWNPDEKSFIGGQISVIAIDGNSSYTGNGVMNQDGSHTFIRESLNKIEYYILTASMLFEHDFSNSQKIQLNGAFNVNGNQTKGEQEETYSDLQSLSGFYPLEYKNRRTSSTVDADYSQNWNNRHYLGLGSSFSWTNDNIDKISDHVPVFIHKELSEYLYASFSSQLGKLYYMCSIGVKGTWLNAGGESNSYFTPHLSVSGSYRLGNAHSVQFSYSKTSYSPQVGVLNPYNMSTDPMVISKGNPNLKPEMKRHVGGGYSFNHNNLYISLSANFEYASDVIEPYGYTENGAFISTYRNMGHYGLFEFGPNINYNLPKGLGQVHLSYTCQIDYFENMKRKDRSLLSCGFNLNPKKWNISGNIGLTSSEYTPISRTKYLTPNLSMVSVSYQTTPNLLIYSRLYWLFGYKYETTTSTDSYTSYSWSRQKRTWCPLFGIRYYLRKNPKQKIRQNNTIRIKEQGIKLTSNSRYNNKQNEKKSYLHLFSPCHAAAYCRG